MKEENASEQLQQIVDSAEKIEVPVMPAQAAEYAGFWARFAAALLDGIIIFMPITFIVQLTLGKSFASNILIYAIGWTYMIYMLNTRQATLGKMVAGLKVIAVDGGKVTIGKLALREIVGKSILNTLTLGIGYLMIVFTEKKQGLHDIIADTVVVYDPARKRRPWLTVVGIVFSLLIPIMGIVTGVVLVGLNSARNKASDEADKHFLKANYSYAYLYADSNNNSLIGFKLSPEVDFEKCSGNPIFNVSEDGQNIAIFNRSCVNPAEYFCVHVDLSNKHINQTAEEVNDDIVISIKDIAFANSGKYSCK